MQEMDKDTTEREEVKETTIADKFLTFSISQHEYGLPISDIIEIVNIQKATVIPNTPDYVKGVINLRGRIVPLVDMNLRFSNEEQAYNERTCIVVVEIDGEHIGLIVDLVHEVLDILEIAPPPEGNVGESSNFVSGIGKMPGGGMILLLDTLAVIDKKDTIMDSAIG